MYDDIELIIKAKNNDKIMNDLIAKYKFFILKCCADFCKKYIDDSDDEFSIAQYAFCKAIKKFDSEHYSNFKAYANTAIRNSLTDNLRRQKGTEVSVSPFAFEDNILENDEAINYSVSKIINGISIMDDSIIDRKYEIDAISQTLKEYEIDFFDLVSCSPKSEKTKSRCAKAIKFLLNDTFLIKRMRKTHTLPIKNIEINSDVPRKVLE
ncbi:MAG: sigma-70 family RNA polymerase sigma factor, partial [Oscillospiraceae bacterium]